MCRGARARVADRTPARGAARTSPIARPTAPSPPGRVPRRSPRDAWPIILCPVAILVERLVCLMNLFPPALVVVGGGLIVTAMLVRAFPQQTPIILEPVGV